MFSTQHTRHSRHHFISYLLLIFCALIGTASAEVAPVWSTGVALPGEQVVLYLIDTEIKQDTFTIKEQPRVRNASVKVQQPVVDANPMDPNREMVEILPIIMRADKAGELKPENIIVEYRSGRKTEVKIPPLPVCSTADIKWYNTPISYGALWYTDTREGYVNQPIRAALKILLPQDYHVASLPQMNAVGVKLTPMQISVQGVLAILHSKLMENTTAFAHGNTWNTADFTGELTPFREGNSDVAGKLLVTRRHGIFALGQDELVLPTLSLATLPLPPGAPADFADTVGEYTISSKTSATSLAMNEAIEVEITVRGTGNIQQLTCPPPADAEDWKLVPATRKPIVSPGGETIGMVFSQLMRPVTEVGGIPPFTLSYFDPAAMAYKKASTAPIPLPWRETDTAGAALVQAAAPPPAGSIPVAEMTDIYDYVPQEAAGNAALYYALPRWLWYLLYLPALGIFCFIAGRALLHRAAMRAGDRARERELAAISRENNGLAFLKRIGAFIESNIPAQAISPELEAILRQRDDEAFRPEAAPIVPPEQRTGMLKSVRKALATVAGKTLLLALLLLPVLHSADPAEELYHSRQYTKALEALKQQVSSLPNAVNTYNRGNIHYRLGKPGVAALHYARALQLDPTFAEARANLSFIQRKEGAILPIRSGVDSVFTLLTCSQLWMASIICTAALLLCIALLLLLRRRPHSTLLTSCTVLFAVLSLLCTLDWVYYATRETPDLSSLPPGDIAYVLRSATARTAASDEAGSVVQLPPSTPVHLLARRGSWAYVETTTGVRGWVPGDSVEALCPGREPRLPLSIRFY